jgi:hypothetical protein
MAALNSEKDTSHTSMTFEKIFFLSFLLTANIYVTFAYKVFSFLNHEKKEHTQLNCTHHTTIITTIKENELLAGPHYRRSASRRCWVALY